MDERSRHNPQWLREQAEQCSRLAKEVWDDQTHDALVSYAGELRERAERMEGAIRRASAEPQVPADPQVPIERRGGQKRN